MPKYSEITQIPLNTGLIYSYAMGRNASGITLNDTSTVAGDKLRPSSAGNFTAEDIWTGSGTWRTMGVAAGEGSNADKTTVFVRIA